MRHCVGALLLWVTTVHSFSVLPTTITHSTTALLAKQKKLSVDAFAFDDDDDDQPKLSKKDLLKKLKGGDNAATAATAAVLEKKEPSVPTISDDKSKNKNSNDSTEMSAKMKKMLAMDALDAAQQESSSSTSEKEPKLSGKEQKALQKKLEKEEERLAKKAAKKLAGPVLDGKDDEEVAVVDKEEPLTPMYQHVEEVRFNVSLSCWHGIPIRIMHYAYAFDSHICTHTITHSLNCTYTHSIVTNKHTHTNL